MFVYITLHAIDVMFPTTCFFIVFFGDFFFNVFIIFIEFIDDVKSGTRVEKICFCVPIMSEILCQNFVPDLDDSLLLNC